MSQIDEYFREQIAFVRDQVALCKPERKTQLKIEYEKELEFLINHRKRYLNSIEKAWESNGKNTIGKIIIVENTMEYLKGFRDGVLRREDKNESD